MRKPSTGLRLSVGILRQPCAREKDVPKSIIDRMDEAQSNYSEEKKSDRKQVHMVEFIKILENAN